MLCIFLVDTVFACVIIRDRLIGTTKEQHITLMPERIHKATLSQSQGREGWSVIFRHPVLLDRKTGKPGRRVRRGLGTKNEKVATRLIAALNELLADSAYWGASSRAQARTRFPHIVVEIFYHDM